MFRRLILFFALNFVIVLTVSTVLQIFNVGPYITRYGLNYESLAIFCLVWGMIGAFISLFLSKKIAKWMLGVQIINPFRPNSAEAEKVYNLCQKLAQRASLSEIPEVGIFNSKQPNAFATGWSKKSSLVAVSTGLLEHLSDEEIEAVLAHEISHIVNGDMVTMTLLQGVVNAFVMFLARILAFAASGMGRGERNRGGSFMSYFLFTILFEVLFMVLGSMLVAFVSRQREFRADKGAASLVGKQPMISALRTLEKFQGKPSKELDKQKQLAAMMIFRPRRRGSVISLFSTHPPIESRVKALEAYQSGLVYQD